MESAFEVLENGALYLHLDMSVYARPAVMKVLSRWTDLYAISFHKTNTFDITMEPLLENESELFVNPHADAQKVFNELLHEMLRLDVIAQTKDIRQLLVGRALYATCIEACTPETQPSDDPKMSPEQRWEKDSRGILPSWREQR